MTDDHSHDDDEGRVTSPMQEYSGTQARIGAVVALVGIAIAYAVPLALA